MEVMGRVDDEGNSTALHAALGAGHVGVVRVMLECVDEDVRKKMVEAVDRWNTKAADLQEEGMLVAGVRAGARDRAEVGREVRRERAGRGLDGILGSGSGHERGTAGCVVASNRSGFFAGGVRERRLGADLRERSRSVVKEMRGIIAQSLTGEIQPGKLYLFTHDDEPKPAMGTSAREVKCDFDTEGGQQKYSQINFRFDCTDEEFEDDGVDLTGETGHYEEWFDLDEDCQIVFDFSCPPLDDADDEGFEDGD